MSIIQEKILLLLEIVLILVYRINIIIMTDRFNTFFNWLVSWEGSTFEDDKNDKGGQTKYGLDAASHPGLDIKNLTREQAAQIYWKESWTDLHIEELPAGIGEIVSNIAINCGTGKIKWLQEIAGVTPDGKIGPATIAAVNKLDRQEVIDKLLTKLTSFYRAIGVGTNQRFVKGWLNRTADLKDFVAKLKP